MLFRRAIIIAIIALDQLHVIESHFVDEVFENDRRFKRATSFSQAEIEGILNSHNDYRGSVSPEASNMEYMVSISLSYFCSFR